MKTRRPTRGPAFTLVEMMIAIALFSMVLAAIYSSWTAILRASKTGLEAAASAQRARVAVRVLEDSLGSAQSFAANLPYYYFDAENGDSPVLSFVSRLSKSFPRSGKFGDLDLRRVTFSLETEPEGGRQLVLRQWPLVMEPDQDEKEHPVVLAKNVKGMEMQFWDSNRNPPEWVDTWEGPKTNQLPKLVMLTLKLADNPHSGRITEEITRIISLPAMTVQPVWQLSRGPNGPARNPWRAGYSGHAWNPGRAAQSRYAGQPRRNDHQTTMKIIRASFHRPAVAITHRASCCTAHGPGFAHHARQLPSGLRPSDFGLPSGFGFRVSDLAPRPSQQGIALLIVMISVMVLTILAAGFAYSMKVETQLARNANNEPELEWLGRSGVEYARWVLANSMLNPQQPYDSLDQPWSTGTGFLGPTNAPIAYLQNPFSLGHGTVSWKITDLESKFNINAPEQILQQVLPQALTLMGVAPGEATPIVNSILDWLDPDDQIHVEGAETRYYEGLTPPYQAKNGPIDDISELLLIKGVTPEIYYGGMATNFQANYFSRQRNPFGQQVSAMPTITAGMTNLFTPLSDGKININTASAEVLQLLPGIDAMMAEAIVGGRSGEDDGSGLLGPYRSVGQVSRVPQLPLPVIGQLGQYCDVRSKTFRVDVTATVNNYSRYFTAILGRNSPRDVQVLSFYWNDPSEPKH